MVERVHQPDDQFAMAFMKVAIDELLALGGSKQRVQHHHEVARDLKAFQAESPDAALRLETALAERLAEFQEGEAKSGETIAVLWRALTIVCQERGRAPGEIAERAAPSEHVVMMEEAGQKYEANPQAVDKFTRILRQLWEAYDDLGPQAW